MTFLSIVAFAVFAARGWVTLGALFAGDAEPFLAFPLSVILPSLVFVFLASLKRMNSAEGALMQLGTMLQLLLIMSWPDFALYLTLGFPVVFLAVEIFETRFPHILRDPVKRLVLA